MRQLTLEDFKATGWNTNDANVLAQVNGILTSQTAAFAKYGITMDAHIAYLLAQLSHESAEGSHLTESLNYTPAALLKIFPTHFTPDRAQQYGRTADHPANQKMIAEFAYGGRMGNAPTPSEDGYNFRGRGFIQTTGKNGYQALATKTGLPLLTQPDLLTDPQHSFECAVAQFVSYPHILMYCESGDLAAVSSLINLGHVSHQTTDINGYADRQAQTTLWKHQLAVA
jgi:putative chitinase